MNRLPRVFLCLAALFFLPLLDVRSNVLINEVMTAGSERALQWSNGVPQYGFGTPWHSPAFNDSSWQVGNGPFGFGRFNGNALPIGTDTATQMQNLTPTLYLRKTFNVSAPDAARADSLRLYVQYNDGFVCYINGKEVTRRNAGPTNQFVYRDQFAAFGTPANNEDNTTPQYRTEVITLPAANTILVPGTNVIAIHALNYWESTSAINTSTNAFVTIDNRNNFYIKADLGIGSDAAIVTNNSPWRYFPGLVEPSGGVFDPARLFSAKQSVPWGRTAFDDSEWTPGSAPFGAGTPPGGVTLGTNLTTRVPGKATSVYFRIVFTATAADMADLAPVQLLMDYDDSFVAYVNGVEVARDRLGQPHAFTPYSAVAESARSPGSSTTFTIDPPARLLSEGQNVLAVQVHNLSLNDADLFFRCRLQRTGGARILVDYTNVWRYFVGVDEPLRNIGEAEEEQPEAPDSQLDWVELHNSGATAVSLDGWYLSDDPSDRTKWKFPSGVTIPAGGYLVVICDGLDIKSPPAGGYLHTNFSLSRSGETVGLYSPTAQIVHELPVPALTAFQSYGAVENGQFRYLSPPTPGSSNAPTAFEGIVEAPVFGIPGGFYDNQVSVSLFSGTTGASIRYTTDGSEPTETTGLAYSSPINVPRPATVNSPGVVIRARAFKAGMLPSQTKTNTYLINQSVGRRSVPALCITGDQQRTLYRPFGLMAIVGGAFTNMAAPLPTGNNGMWTQAGASSVTNADLSAYNNVIHRGRFTERPAVMELFYPGGAPSVNIDFGMRISGSNHARPRYQLANQNRAPGSSPSPNEGGWSASSTQKPSFNFYFRGDLGGDPLEFKLFPFSPVTKFHDIRVRAGKNDPSNPFIEDEFVRRLFVDLGQVGSTGIINTLYVNGVYKGYYNACEHLREEFFQQQHGSDLPWDVRQVTTIASGDGLAFQEMITFIRNNSPGVLANYRAMKTRLDMVNFVDYLIINLFGVTGDWPHNNYVCARERSANGLHRYYVWDAEGAFGDFSGNVRTNQFVSGTTGSIITTNPSGAGLGEGIRILYTYLRQSPEFRLLFADRLQKHFFNGGALTESHVLGKWNAMKSEFQQVLGSTVTDRVTPWVNGRGDATRYSLSGTTVVNEPSRRNVLFNGYIDDSNGVFVQAHLVAEGLWPSIKAPEFSPFGGTVVPGSTVTITNPNPSGAGTIYYTLDGRDPRAEGGAIQGEAYTGPVAIDFSTTLRARVLAPNGLWSPVTEAFFDTGATPPLLITEIMYHPADNGSVNGDEYEFLELKNVGAQPVNLHGLSFSSGITYSFPPGAILPPGGHGVIARNAAAFTSRYPDVPLIGSWGPSSNLSNSGEKLTIVDAVGRTVFSVTYSDTAPWPVAPDGNGQSLVPVNPNSIPSPDDATNWRASTANGGSPGSDDPTPAVQPVYINELLAYPITGGDMVELYNPNASPIDVSHWWLSDDISTPRKYRLPEGSIIPGGGYLVIEEAAFNAGAAAFAFSSAGDEAILSSGDSTGNLTGYSHIFRFAASEPGVSFGRYVNSVGAEFFPAQKHPTFGAANSGPRTGPVAITELMVQPTTGGDEYVEIQNTSTAPVALYDPANPGNTWRIDGIAFSFPPGTVLQPGQIAIVAPIAPATFSSKYSIPQSTPVFGPYTGALNNSGERVTLQKPGIPYQNTGGQPVTPYIDVDAVTYDDAAPWPSVAANGKTLERLNVHAFGDDPANWQATTGGSAARPAALPFNTWLAQRFTAAQLNDPAIGAPDADPDGDGLSNLQEWAQGSDPNNPGTSSISSAVETHGDGKAYLTLRFRRNIGATGLNASVDTTSDLSNWNLNSGISAGTPINNGDGTETVIVRDTVPIEGGASAPRFMRLRFTAP